MAGDLCGAQLAMGGFRVVARFLRGRTKNPGQPGCSSFLWAPVENPGRTRGHSVSAEPYRKSSSILIAGRFLPCRIEIPADPGHQIVSAGFGWWVAAKSMAGDFCRVRLAMMGFRVVVRFLPDRTENPDRPGRYSFSLDSGILSSRVD